VCATPYFRSALYIFTLPAKVRRVSWREGVIFYGNDDNCGANCLPAKLHLNYQKERNAIAFSFSTPNGFEPAADKFRVRVVLIFNASSTRQG
jgi:hypothetical protein